MVDLGRRAVGPLPRASRDAEIGAHVLAALEERAPVTVLRAPRGYGKTTAIVRWLEGSRDELPTAYVLLDAEARTAEGFWTSVRRALVAAGCTDPDDVSDDPRLATLGSLDKHDEPWRLVIDNFHEAGHLDGTAGQIDEDLLERVRANRELELVVATRSLRSLETLGALSVDLAVLRPADLALRPEEVVRLARRRGLDVSLDRAQRLVDELGGWPAAIRSCLDEAALRGPEAPLDSSMVDVFIEALLADLRSSSLREFLVRTSIPEEFSAAAVAQIVPGRTGIRELRNLRVAGLLQERETVDGLRYSYPPSIREALRRVAQDHYPTVEREVHLALMVLAAQEEGPVGVLRHALLAGEWDTALRIIEEEWQVLVTYYPRELAAVADGFPAELQDSEPRLRVLRHHLDRLTSPPGAARVRWRPAPAHFVDDAVQQRWMERHGIVDDVDVLVQSGVAAIFAGENDVAAYAFEQVRHHGLVQNERSARLLGAGGLLTAKAIHGETDLALELLEDPELAAIVAEGGDDEVSRLVALGGRIMRAIASVDAMHPETPEVMRAVQEPVRRDELWALAILSRGLYASVYGTEEEQARAVGQLRAALRHTQPGSIAESALGTQLVELLVAGGHLDLAQQALDRLPDTFVTSPTLAYLRYAQGREQEAVAAADRAIGDPRTTHRSRATSEVIAAAALLRLGQATAARRRFARAVSVAHETGQRRPFVLIPADAFTALTDGDERLLALRPSSAHAVSAASPASAVVAELSARELQVLTALHDHAGPAGVAEALGMSVNTAKTHLRHVYRKLGAAGREEAVVLSRGLIPERM